MTVHASGSGAVPSRPTPGIPPRAVLFDAGFTLLHPSGALLLAEIAAAGVEVGELTSEETSRALLLASEARHLSMPRGLSEKQKVARVWGSLLGLTGPAALVSCLRALSHPRLRGEPDPEAVAVLTGLRDRGIRLGVIADACHTVDDLAQSGLLPFFEAVVDSTSMEAGDAEPLPLQTALQLLGLPGEECWYVTASLCGIALAEPALGYARGILVDGFGNAPTLPGMARIRRLTDLSALLRHGELAQLPPVDPNEALWLADVATRALSTLWDPEARISPPMWRRAERLGRAILATLERASAGVTSPVPLSSALDELRSAPLARGARTRLHAAVRNLLTANPPTAAALRGPVTTFDRRNRIDQRLGGRYDPQRPVAAVNAAELAATCRPTCQPLTGSWELTVVVDFRDTHGGFRLRNTVAALAALHDQTLPRNAYRIVVVEQDNHERHRALVEPLADRYVLAPYGGPYNRSWAHNVGAVATGRAERYLCFLDADVMVDRTFLAGARDFLGATGSRALLPHASLFYLDQHSSEVSVRQRLISASGEVDDEECHGYRLMTNRGGCIFVEAELFHAAGGYDERYEGWGDEDNEFYERIAACTTIAQLAQDLLHLYHPRPVMEHNGWRPNEGLLGEAEGRPERIGDPSRYGSTAH